MSDAYFSRLMPSLAERSGQAAISRLGFANIPIRHRLRELFEQPYGAAGAFLADPAFEATFGWKTAAYSINALQDRLLTPELIKAMDQAGDHAFKRQMFPYRHQLESWEILNRADPQSLVVTSGTGSGKTECFMMPILDYLVRQRSEYGRLVGVRALFLYPLNALINNQRNRLRAWTEPFDADIRFCLYNGNTPERPARSAGQRSAPSEVLDRQSLRSRPPPILVTNSTMLEYMLVRTQDAPILEQSQGKLEWVVLDEAHTYIGSQAAEIALLLRRVMSAFGVTPEQVRFIATSATIGDPAGSAGAELRRFLADIAGVDIERVHLIAGERDIPSLSDSTQYVTLNLQDIEQIDADSEVSCRRYTVLSEQPVARKIRRLFTEDRQGNSVVRLSQVCQTLFGASASITKAQQLEALRWLDLLSGTCRQTDGESFLPLRAHFFHQTLSGIWACADKNCAKREGSLRESAWPYGALYMEPRKRCACGSPAYEVVSCSDCGEVYLLAGESKDCLHHLRPPHLLDDFELEADERMEEEPEKEELEEPSPGRHQNRVLIANRRGAKVGPLSIDRETRKITERSDTTLDLLAQENDDSGLSCPQCQVQEPSSNQFFRHGRLSAPFLLGNILPTLLEYAPDGNKPQDHPYRGRRLLSFTDSRQGTARLAAKLQQDAERSRVRGLVYHLSLASSSNGDPARKEKLKQELEELRKVPEITSNDTLARMLKEKEVELAQLDKPQPVTFNALATSLAGQARDIGFMRETYRHNAPDLFAHGSGDITLARMFLVREFGRRPKRANNLETMGLIATHYPALDKITEVPPEVVTHAGFDLQAWRDFLKICLDFFVRGGGSLNFPREWKNWLGMRFGQTWLAPYSAEEVARGQRRWPSVRRGRSNSKLVRLLAYVLGVDPGSPAGADRIDSTLRHAWSVLLEKSLLRQDAQGWRLPMDAMAFLPIQQAFICPVTRRLLDTTLNHVTPYLPGNATPSTAVCEVFEIPNYPTPFGDVADERERIRQARDWLRDNPQLDELRDQSLWPSLNDRVIELAPFFKTAEHSAQQDARRLQGYENAFQAGDINLLSCSTTMEMGIDIGGVSLISMNNVPPHPASYLQRAGRAGRRRESRSLAMTLCKSNPHDQIVFSDTRWAFDTCLAAPRVSLDSPVIVQRHVHAVLLTAFFKKQLAQTDQSQLKLNCGAFFLGEPQSLADNFSSWCRGKRTRLPQALKQNLQQLLRRTLYERTTLDGLLKKAADEMKSLASAWSTEWGNLKAEQEQIKSEAGERSPAYRAVSYHMRRLEKEYLLRDLANRGFLPAYGFPSHITPFDNYTVDQFKRDKRAQGREDNRNRFREMPSRELATALREYAPGSQVVMDGLVYRSAGLTLNWHVPADQEDVREAQNIKFAWRCHQCGDSGTTYSLRDAGICPSCETDIRPANQRQFIEPAGFAVDFYETPNNDIDNQQFIPVEAPWIAPDGEWLSLPNPDLGRFRTTTKGHIYHQSRGIHGAGYALCLECGRAEPMSPDDSRPEHFTKPHRKLRRSKDDAPYCPGSDDFWKVKTGITLGHESWTDVCEFQLKTSEGIWFSDQVAAATLAVALRDALAELIGVQSTELACATKPVRTESGESCQSIILFDRYAAGYASSVARYLYELFSKAKEKLLCPNDCDSVCPHCVLDFDQRFAAEEMDRHRGLEILTEQWMNGFRVPDRYAYFGEHTRPVFQPLIDSIWQAVSSGHLSELRLYAGGELDCWNIAQSPLKKLTYQIASNGLKVSLVMPAIVPDRLDQAERYLLSSLADAPNITLYACQTELRCGKGWLLAEAIGPETERWAGDNRSALRFDTEWGQNENLLLAVTAPEAPALNATPLSGGSIRPAIEVAGDRELEIGKELDGKLKTFGKRFWAYLTRKHDPSRALLDSADPIKVVRYQDRYLFSPLPVRLLLDVVKALRDRVGEARWSKSVMEIETLTSKSHSNLQGKAPKFLWDDWEDQVIRIEVIKTLFADIGMVLNDQFNEGRRQAHTRLLEVHFASGRKLRLRLDQGISYWRISRSADYRSKTFNFMQTDAKQQAAALLRVDVPIAGDEHATQIFIRTFEEVDLPGSIR